MWCRCDNFKVRWTIPFAWWLDVLWSSWLLPRLDHHKCRRLCPPASNIRLCVVKRIGRLEWPLWRATKREWPKQLRKIGTKIIIESSSISWIWPRFAYLRAILNRHDYTLSSACLRQWLAAVVSPIRSVDASLAQHRKNLQSKLFWFYKKEMLNIKFGDKFSIFRSWILPPPIDRTFGGPFSWNSNFNG